MGEGSRELKIRVVPKGLHQASPTPSLPQPHQILLYRIPQSWRYFRLISKALPLLYHRFNLLENFRRINFTSLNTLSNSQKILSPEVFSFSLNTQGMSAYPAMPGFIRITYIFYINIIPINVAYTIQ